MLVPFTFAFLTWRECVVGMKATEMVQMDVRRTWDILPSSSSGSRGGQTLGGDTQSETLGYVRWRMRDDTLFDKPCRRLYSEAYDKKAAILVSEEVWTAPAGDIVRQREERTTLNGKQTSDAAFYPDHIELTRVDTKGKSTFAEVNPAKGMEEVQRRFKPMDGNRKEFLRLDGIAGSLKRVLIEKAGRFRGTWGGDAYDGPAYRFTIDGKEQTVMLTAQDEIVQIGINDQTAIVLSGATKSRRKGG